jgi:hypothetical protein
MVKYAITIPQILYNPEHLYSIANTSSYGLQQRRLEANETQRKEEARVAKERKELAWRRDHAYDDVMTEENLEQNTNENRDENFLDDFM